MAASLLSGRLVVGQEQPVSVALDARERLFEQLATDAAQFDARNILKKSSEFLSRQLFTFKAEKLYSQANDARSKKQAQAL